MLLANTKTWHPKNQRSHCLSPTARFIPMRSHFSSIACPKLPAMNNMRFNNMILTAYLSASCTGAAEMYRRSSSTYRNRAHWLAGAGQRRGSLPWPLFPVSPARTLEYLEPSSVRHRERAPTGPAPLLLTSTRGASSEQDLARRRRAPATPRASGQLVGRRSLTISHAASSSSLIPAYQGSMDRGGERGHGGAPATRRPENRRRGGTHQMPGVDGISFTVHPLVPVNRQIGSLRS